MAFSKSYRTRVSKGRRGRYVWRIWWAGGKVENGGPFDTEDQARESLKQRIDDYIATGGW